MRVRELTLSIILLLSSCRSHIDRRSFERKHGEWHEKRIERLKSAAGWLNLAGLYWLEEGENTIGSDSSNSIVFPQKAPPRLGRIMLDSGRINFIPDPDAEVMHGDSPAGKMELTTDKSGKPTLLESGSLAWFIIERSPLFGIRLRDYDNPVIGSFKGIETYMPDMEWKITATFEPFEKPRELMIPTVIGTVEKNYCPGILRFPLKGREHELYPVNSGTGLFIIFTDETSGLGTYGSGRFLYTEKPGEDNTVTIDFNRAYNPPCAFTPFATCPLPPPENFLDVRIEAGEKFSGH